MSELQKNADDSRAERDDAQTGKEHGLSQKASHIREMFSLIAPTYDRMNHLLSFSVDKRWRKKMVARTLAASSGQARPLRLLDVCAGTGDLSFAFRRALGDESQVVALDYTHGMLVRAREKSLALREKQGAGADREASLLLLPVEADALRLPFPDNTFDLSTVAFGLRNLVDRPAGLREMARVVRPGGSVLVLEFTLPRSRWFRRVYSFYLHRILPFVGNILTRSTAYAYLADTVEEFPPPEEVCGWLRDAGLDEVVAEPYTGGVAVLYTGVVKDES